MDNLEAEGVSKTRGQVDDAVQHGDRSPAHALVRDKGVKGKHVISGLLVNSSKKVYY